MASCFIITKHKTQKPITNYLLSKKIYPSSSEVLGSGNPNLLEQKSNMHNPVIALAGKLTQEPIIFIYKEPTHNPNKPGTTRKLTFSFSLKPDEDNWEKEYDNVFTKDNINYEIIRWVRKDETTNPRECRYSWSRIERNDVTHNTNSRRMDEQFRLIVQESKTTCKSGSNTGITIEEIDNSNNIKRN